jgi:heterodisulfide reductase subunit A
VKNALELRRRWPDARIVVFYRDMRTYGFREAAYREAREKGVLFIHYEPEQSPQLLDAGGKLRLQAREPSLGRDLVLEPDLVVLAAPAVPRADRAELSELLRVPLNADGFFLEAHMKLRPVDFASEGLFLCGSAHAPKFISETISQATAVAGRAASILSRKKMSVGGQIAWVDPDQCISCMTCVHVCPYMAPQVGTNNKAEVQGLRKLLGRMSGQGHYPAALHGFPNPGGGQQPAGSGRRAAASPARLSGRGGRGPTKVELMCCFK